MTEKPVGYPQLAVKHRDHDKRHRKEHSERPPDPLFQLPGGKLGRLEVVFAVEKTDFSVAFLRLVFLLQFDKSAQLRFLSYLFLERFLAVIEGECPLVIADSFQVASILVDQLDGIGCRPRALIIGDGLIGQALAFGDTPQAEE